MSASTDTAYKVLARKYRPGDFSALIGQEAMVTTLANAMAAGRLAHAFVLTGVRGVGKTTTARIIAKGLNCENADGPTTEPCGVCDSCVAIGESRHVDILEMDAASRTGVDDVREIIENVRYAPVSARYKVYIIDEVHMLSNNAFNALLKTLEEPPEHVKFIFATTEIRKVPVTVLSRCQRFDLRRVPTDQLVGHLGGILAKEAASAEDEALALIARAAEGSVRDSLSILDQALAHGAGRITADQVRAMLGYADRAQIFDLLDALFRGDIEASLGLLRSLYDRGSDPQVVLSDMLELSHSLTRLKVSPALGQEALTSDSEREKATTLAEGLTMPDLTRAWQILLKGLSEVRTAPVAISAAEMVLVRLAHAASLPDPASLVRKLQGQAGSGAVPGALLGGGAAGDAPQNMSAGTARGVDQTQPAGTGAPTASADVIAFSSATARAETPQAKHPMPISYEAMVKLFFDEREPLLATQLTDQVRLISYRPGAMTLNPGHRLPADFGQRVKACLKEWTGETWMLTFTSEAAGESLRDQQQAADEARRAEALEEPLVKAFLKIFPDADLKKVETLDMDAVPVDGEASASAAETPPDALGSFDFDGEED